MPTKRASAADLEDRRRARAEAQAVFDDLAQAYTGRPGVTRGSMFGSTGLQVREKFFAFVGRDGRLITKLPPERAAILVGSGCAEPVRAGRNATREWVGVLDPREPAADGGWSALLEESYEYVRSLSSA